MEISHLESQANKGMDIGLDNYSLRALVGYIRNLEHSAAKVNMTEAERECISIFDDFSGDEVDKMPSSVTSAWYIGRELKRKLG